MVDSPLASTHSGFCIRSEASIAFCNLFIGKIHFRFVFYRGAREAVKTAVLALMRQLKG